VTEHGEDTEHRTHDEKNQQHENERRAPFVTEKVAHDHRIEVLHRERDKEQKDERSGEP
jgi:hypothetical protein